MKSRAYMHLWMPFIVALVMSIAFFAVHIQLKPRERIKAVAELNALLDAAQARTASFDADRKVLSDIADNSAIHKAQTVARFLAHDDTLLETDALKVLCGLLDLDAIMVLNDLCEVIVSSETDSVETSMALDEDMGWCRILLENEDEFLVKTEGWSERIVGVVRTDIEGLVLIRCKDPLLTEMIQQTDIHQAVKNLAIEPDAIKIADTVGEDGVFEQDGMLYVQRASGEVTLISWRPVSEVYATLNAVLISIAVFAVLLVLALFAWQVLSPPRRVRKRPKSAVCEESREVDSMKESRTVKEERIPEQAKSGKKKPRLFEIVKIEDEEDKQEEKSEPVNQPVADEEAHIKARKNKRIKNSEEMTEPITQSAADEEIQTKKRKNKRKKNSESGDLLESLNDNSDLDVAFDEVIE